jgi:hypothetical protein
MCMYVYLSICSSRGNGIISLFICIYICIYEKIEAEDGENGIVGIHVFVYMDIYLFRMYIM